MKLWGSRGARTGERAGELPPGMCDWGGGGGIRFEVWEVLWLRVCWGF